VPRNAAREFPRDTNAFRAMSRLLQASPRAGAGRPFPFVHGEFTYYGSFWGNSDRVLARDRYRLLSGSFPEQYFQAVCRVMRVAQAEEPGAPAEPRMKSRVLAADFAASAQSSPIQPEVGLSIELVLQMMGQRILRGIMACTPQRAVADSPDEFLLDHDREPSACLGADLALPSDKHG
jgi:hypothetical protein